MAARHTPLADSMRSAKGNASPETRDMLAKWWASLSPTAGFAQPICDRLHATEMVMADHALPGKKDAKVVFEIDVREGMCFPCSGGCRRADREPRHVQLFGRDAWRVRGVLGRYVSALCFELGASMNQLGVDARPCC